MCMLKAKMIVCVFFQRGGHSLRRVHIFHEEEPIDLWTLLDPHEKSSSENKPLRKGEATT